MQAIPSRAVTSTHPEHTGWLLDGHVHLYSCFSLERFFTGAVSNAATARKQLGLGSGALACLALTESRGHHCFEQLRDKEIGRECAGWEISATREEASLLVRRRGIPQLVLVAGRQIVTREGLEILALGFTGTVPDRTPMNEVLAATADRSLAVVLPWGFGKWWFRRGKIAAEVLTATTPGKLFVGDNGNRPRLIPVPRLLRRAAARGIGNLPGSDPLPLAFHATRAGRYGTFIRCTPDVARPIQQIQELLRSHHASPEQFGDPEPLPRFLRAQILMQLRKRIGAR